MEISDYWNVNVQPVTVGILLIISPYALLCIFIFSLFILSQISVCSVENINLDFSLFSPISLGLSHQGMIRIVGQVLETKNYLNSP